MPPQVQLPTSGRPGGRQTGKGASSGEVPDTLAYAISFNLLNPSGRLVLLPLCAEQKSETQEG